MADLVKMSTEPILAVLCMPTDEIDDATLMLMDLTFMMWTSWHWLFSSLRVIMRRFLAESRVMVSLISQAVIKNISFKINKSGPFQGPEDRTAE